MQQFTPANDKSFQAFIEKALDAIIVHNPDVTREAGKLREAFRRSPGSQLHAKRFGILVDNATGGGDRLEGETKALAADAMLMLQNVADRKSPGQPALSDESATERITVTMTEREKELLDIWAEGHGMNRSEAIRAAIKLLV